MERLEAGTDTSNLPNEAVTIAKSIQRAYDGITDSMRKNGLTVNKVKNYFANQQYTHNEMKINTYPFRIFKTNLVGKRKISIFI